MPKPKLSQYRGDLDAAQIAHGMNAARRNARRLADDARALHDLTRFPTATAVSILSIEESGKLTILRGLAIAPTPEIRRQRWKDYQSHRSKNVAWIIPELYLKGARTLESLSLAADPSADHTALLDQLKQLSLYTDCLGAGNWCEPANVIDEALSHALLQIADLLAKGRPVTELEVQLWIAHMGPTYGESLERQKASLEAWYAAMTEHGLRDEEHGENGPVSLETFLWGNKH
ncbi:MAG: AbiV family abortive infection protein [Chloroflexi bacterium]|nr:AbiV family abortive infection protein [Chloroflexota bacterium]